MICFFLSFSNSMLFFFVRFRIKRQTNEHMCELTWKLTYTTLLHTIFEIENCTIYRKWIRIGSITDGFTTISLCYYFCLLPLPFPFAMWGRTVKIIYTTQSTGTYMPNWFPPNHYFAFFIVYSEAYAMRRKRV